MVTLIDRRANYAPELAPALPPGHERGRGARSNLSGRYEQAKRYLFDDGWDLILKDQLDYRHKPCNFVEIMPRLEEHLRRSKA